jgi:AraC family transcriptional regulator
MGLRGRGQARLPAGIPPQFQLLCSGAIALTEQFMFTETPLRVVRYQPSAAMAPHDHETASLNIVVNGDFLERIGNSERNYAKGYVAFCPAGMRHSQQFGRSGARQIIFAPQASWIDYLADCKLKLDDAPYAGSHIIRHLGDRLLDESRNDDAFSLAAREGILLEIVAAFGRNSSTSKPSSNPPAWLCAAREFMHAHALAPLSMKRIAKAAGRHEIHLAREFRRYFGASVGAYLRRLRIEHAARLLLEPQTSISEIALICGFASHSHLCREFRAHYGVTPSQYRTMN